MPHLRQLLQSNDNWLDHLVDDLKISAVHCQVEPHLVSLKYSQIESDMSHPLVQECRGAVVNKKTRSIVALPYFKFWNHGEHLAAPINWNKARIQEKLDGSLMTLYWDSDINLWRVASSGHPTAGGTVWPGTQTFHDLFWQTFASLNMKLPYPGDRGSSFCFELCTDANRIVCKHSKPRLVCHGARILDNEWEWQRVTLEKVCSELDWEIVKEYPLGTLDDVLKAAEALNPVENEGFVVVDDNFNRVKIKSPRYVALHHLKSNISTEKNMATLVLSGEDGEFLAHFPEMTADFDRTKAILDASMAELKALYEQYRHIESQKEFALAIVGKSKMTNILFNARKHKLEIEDAWKQSADTIIKTLF